MPDFHDSEPEQYLHLRMTEEDLSGANTFYPLDPKFVVYYSAATPERRWSDDKF